mmetsp:Transcript_18115/g.20284  ORF Transcript_18115/g.20284 Transcript_18115/m.20284 type:complete len:230 (+) Transcript_18115:317-1006(+)|eukprot:CAMPEP_0205812510 /NCGR_PEP_ID=MMETSP0205-20121125/16957_1 /ASSEMBLY_ACC=CAM_ASM_000278 /TAXON_ID=36767 /ORGANISM="Euplotes focardii, Strain TN1" /LENGTH=229 /DNA_ID=CAMNT_0053093247 /DNA_START=296 /DNA_END=985 /DNA_ORIENTATION=-
MFVLKVLPNLTKLDEVDVTPEEIEAASSISIDEEDLAIGGNEPSHTPPPAEPPVEYEKNEPYNYESPTPAPTYERNEVAPPSQSSHRSPPRSAVPEELKQPSYPPQLPQQPSYPSQLPEHPSAPSHGVNGNPAYWSRGPSGGDIYASGAQQPPPSFEVPKMEINRPQTSQPYIGEAPPLRYGMNETGSYLPPQPRLMHSHSTPMTAHPSVAAQAPMMNGGGKYQNENIL